MAAAEPGTVQGAPAVRLTICSEPDEASVYPAELVDRLVVMALGNHVTIDAAADPDADSQADDTPFAMVETLDGGGHPHVDEVDYTLSNGTVLSSTQLLDAFAVAIVDAITAAVADH